MNQIIRKLSLASSLALGLCGVGVVLAADLARNAKSDQVMDAHREMQILTSFNTNPQLHAYDLIVIVDGNKAAIGGAVESDLARDLAGKIAQNVDGIEHVDNRIRVDASAVPPKRDSSERSFKGG